MAAIYIEWTEQSAEFVGWNYVGGGCTDALLKPVTVQKSALYSSTVTAVNVERAKAYIATDMQDRPDAKVVIK